jgi:hypothetical protein
MREACVLGKGFVTGCDSCSIPKCATLWHFPILIMTTKVISNLLILSLCQSPTKTENFNTATLSCQNLHSRATALCMPRCVPYPFSRTLEMLPFGAGQNNNHFTEDYTPVWGTLVPADDIVARRYLLPSCQYVDVLISISRRFRNAIGFSHELPFINPSRASPELVMREGKHIVLANAENRHQTAVFLTMGIVSQCQIVSPTWNGNSSNASQVWRISVCPFTIEYQRTVSMIGNALDLGHGTDSFLGPLSDGNLVFRTRPQSANLTSMSITPCAIVFSDHL